MFHWGSAPPEWLKATDVSNVKQVLRGRQTENKTRRRIVALLPAAF